MSKLLQVLCYAITFALALWVGVFFSFLITWEQFCTQQYLPGKPLPGMLLFYFNNPVAVPYLFLDPWLLFVGLPFLPYVRTAYWDLNMFFLRFCVFFSLEMFFIIFSAIAFYLPFMGMSGGMSDSDVSIHVTWIEGFIRCSFWLGSVLFLLAVLWRVKNRSKLKISLAQ